MRLIPQIIGYDVIRTDSGQILAYAVPTQQQAMEIAETDGGSIVIPVIKSAAQRIGYAVRSGK